MRYGDSGGPLIDARGRVVGVTSATNFSSDGYAQFTQVVNPFTACVLARLLGATSDGLDVSACDAEVAPGIISTHQTGGR